MNGLWRGLTSSVGAKFVAAVTGLLLLLFVIGHMLGNLQVFLGPEALNSYAAKLQGLGPGLWVVRGGLLAVFAVHVWAVLRLQLHNWSARPVAYAMQKPLKSTLTSRTMIWTGLLIASFVVYHLLHFTVKPTGFAWHGLDDQGHPDVYKMVVLAFQQAPVAISYVIAMILLGLHLFHGIPSIFQSLGWNPPKYQGVTRMLGRGLAILIVIGNVSMPLLILLGVIGLPEGGN